jgi:Na+/H+-translocating membrane pyrophosphatase
MTAIGLSVIGFIILYVLNQLFGLNTDTAKTVMAALLSVSFILILIMIAVSIFQVILILSTSNNSRDTFANRARLSYPVLMAHAKALSKNFTKDELQGFSEWAEYRIKMEASVAILIGVLIAALPKLSDLFTHFKKEIFQLAGKSGESSSTQISLEFLPISLESIAFLVLFFVFIIRFIAFRWSTVLFYAKFAADRLRTT